MSRRILSNCFILGVAATLATACVVEDGSSDPVTVGSGGSSDNGDTGGQGGAGATDGGDSGGSAGAGSGGDGSDTGGSAGAGGGEGSGEVEPYLEDCDDGDAVYGMDSRDDAVPLGQAEICTAAGTVHWFSVTTPDTGGAHVLKLDIDQGPEARVRVTAFADADKTVIGNHTVAMAGASRTLYITVGSDTVTYLQVEQYTGEGRVDLELTQTPEADEYEPNNERDEAAPIDLDEDITAQMMIPYVSDTDQVSNDWYAVELEGGVEAKLALTEVPDNVRFKLAVVDSSGSNQGSRSATNNGALVDYTFTPSDSGTYYIDVSMYSADSFGPFISNGESSHLVDSYTLRVTQE